MSGPQTYRRRPATVEAMQWDGTPESATRIVNWVLANNGGARYQVCPVGYLMLDLGNSGSVEVAPGAWIVLTGGQFLPCPATVFVKQYEAAEPADKHAAIVARLRALADELDWANELYDYGSWSPGGLRFEADELEANP